jgi:hypothetical protein
VNPFPPGRGKNNEEGLAPFFAGYSLIEGQGNRKREAQNPINLPFGRLKAGSFLKGYDMILATFLNWESIGLAICRKLYTVNKLPATPELSSVQTPFQFLQIPSMITVLFSPFDMGRI